MRKRRKKVVVLVWGRSQRENSQLRFFWKIYMPFDEMHFDGNMWHENSLDYLRGILVRKKRWNSQWFVDCMACFDQCRVRWPAVDVSHYDPTWCKSTASVLGNRMPMLPKNLIVLQKSIEINIFIHKLYSVSSKLQIHFFQMRKCRGVVRCQ